jgi:hypothetical protein
MANANTDGFKGQLLYPLDDPETAFRNAMKDQGYNPYAENPFIKTMQRAAPGLAVSYASDMAMGGMYGNPNDTAGVPDFGQYLRETIAGGPNRNIVERLRGHSDPNQIQRNLSVIRNYRQLQSDGLGANFNPYVAYLSDLYGEDNGKGLTNAILATRAPLLGTPLARSYRSGLDASYESAWNRMVRAGDDRGDVWRYIMGF